MDVLFDNELCRYPRHSDIFKSSSARLSIHVLFLSLWHYSRKERDEEAMGIRERKTRDREERERRIVVAARTIAERDGWASVTIRRLADEIEYSQPVLYSHFANRDEIVGAVALEGFGELAAMLRASILPSSTPEERVRDVATAYLDFAFARPALYEAMFILPTGLRFARSDTPAPLREAFGAMATVVSHFAQDSDTETETFWASLHGLTELERHGRIRPAFRAQRIARIVRMFSGQA
jgi:AcrR family transcriptional regulator